MSYLTLAQHNQTFELQKRMEVPVAQIFGRILSPETPLDQVPGYVSILTALHDCEYPDDTCTAALMFLAEVVHPAVTNTVQ